MKPKQLFLPGVRLLTTEDLIVLSPNGRRPSLAMRCVKSLSISSKRKPTRSGRIWCGTGAVINRRTDRVGHEIL
jgi:hypothetical protein